MNTNNCANTGVDGVEAVDLAARTESAEQAAEVIEVNSIEDFTRLGALLQTKGATFLANSPDGTMVFTTADGQELQVKLSPEISSQVEEATDMAVRLPEPPVSAEEMLSNEASARRGLTHLAASMTMAMSGVYLSGCGRRDRDADLDKGAEKVDSAWEAFLDSGTTLVAYFPEIIAGLAATIITLRLTLPKHMKKISNKLIIVGLLLLTVSANFCNHAYLSDSGSTEKQESQEDSDSDSDNDKDDCNPYWEDCGGEEGDDDVKDRKKKENSGGPSNEEESIWDE